MDRAIQKQSVLSTSYRNNGPGSPAVPLDIAEGRSSK